MSRAAPPQPSEASPSVRTFVLRFCSILVLLEALIFFVLWQEAVFRPYAAWNATLTALCLGPFLDGVQATGNVISAPGFSISVRAGCDAYQAIAVFLAGVVAFPAPRSRKLWGALAGVVVLLALNLARLGALLWTGIHHPASFDLMHLEILPALYVAGALASLLGWIVWARP